MKCIYCGMEINDGSLFCSHCGKEVQIVPDYNAYEEDEYLKQVMKESNRRNSSIAAAKTAAARRKKKLTIIIVLTIVVVFLAAAIGLMVSAKIRNDRANSLEYQLMLAREAEQAGNSHQAIEYYENALSLDKDNIDIRLTLVDIYLKRKDYDSAMILCHEILQLDGKNRKACETLISIFESQKNYDAVLSLYENVDEELQELFTAYMVSAPEFSIESGELKAVRTLELSTTGEYEIFYTMDGSDPKLRGERYSTPIELNENYKTYSIHAVCMNDKGIYSEVVEKEYTLRIPAPALPVVTPDGGEFTEETTVAITVPTGCTAYYTWDGSQPSAYSEKYTEPLTVPEGNHLLSVIIIDDTTQLFSEIYQGNFIYYTENNEGEYMDDSDE